MCGRDVPALEQVRRRQGWSGASAPHRAAPSALRRGYSGNTTNADFAFRQMPNFSDAGRVANGEVVASRRWRPHCSNMVPPLLTISYDNVVLIDSQVVLEAKPLDQLPWADLFTGSILLLVTRQVQTEIDKRKNDGRLGKRARAFNRLLDRYIVDRVPSSVLANPQVDVATIANRKIDWDALDDLDRDDPDDRIIAQALNANVDDPTRLVFLSHDMRPRDAASSHGLAAVKLPETWLKDPDPSPEQRRISELEAKNRLLSADQPQVDVRLEAVTPSPWLYRDVGEATSAEVDELIDRLLANAPRQARPTPFDIQGLGTFDHSHAGRLKDWEQSIRRNTPLIHRGLTRLYAQQRVRVTVENIGPISAEGLSLEIRSGNTVLHSIPYWILITGPGAPQPRLMHDHLLGFNPRLIPVRREPFTFYWDERGPSDHLMQSCSSFRQGKSYSLEISVELLSRSIPKAQIEAVVTASNMKGDVRSQAIIDVERAAVPFRDIYDVTQGALVLRPSVDLADDCETSDYNWYENCGSEYEPGR